MRSVVMVISLGTSDGALFVRQCSLESSLIQQSGPPVTGCDNVTMYECDAGQVAYLNSKIGPCFSWVVNLRLAVLAGCTELTELAGGR